MELHPAGKRCFHGQINLSAKSNEVPIVDAKLIARPITGRQETRGMMGRCMLSVCMEVGWGRFPEVAGVSGWFSARNKSSGCDFEFNPVKGNDFRASQSDV